MRKHPPRGLAVTMATGGAPRKRRHSRDAGGGGARGRKAEVARRRFHWASLRAANMAGVKGTERSRPRGRAGRGDPVTGKAAPASPPALCRCSSRSAVLQWSHRADVPHAGLRPGVLRVSGAASFPQLPPLRRC